MYGRPAPAGNSDDIADRRPCWRCRHRDTLGESRQWPLQRRIEQPFCLQLGLELLKGEKQPSEACGFHEVYVELVLSSASVHTYVPVSKHTHAALRTEAKPSVGPLEHDRAQTRSVIFERHVHVPGRMVREVGYLAAYPHIGKDRIRLKQPCHPVSDLGD